MLGNRVAGQRRCQISSLPPQHWQIVPTFYQRVSLLAVCPWLESDVTFTRSRHIKTICVNRLERWDLWARANTHLHVCMCVCDPMPACIFICMDRARQNRTTADHLSGIQSVHLLSRGQWWAYRCAPTQSPTPLSPPLTSSLRIDPPSSVRCSQDQQPRQCPFHHSGPQCSFHKLSQALGLKGRIAMGFGLCKHTDSCRWQVGAQNTMTPSPLLPSSLHPSLNLCRHYTHIHIHSPSERQHQ